MARDAKKKYDAALTAAETNYSRTKSNARQALIEDLQAAMKEAVRAADAEEVVNLQAAINSVKLAEAAAQPQGRLYLLVGRWRVEFANGVVETCEIRTDGTAVVVEPQRKAEGKVTSQDGSLLSLASQPSSSVSPFLIACNDDRIERWTPVGRRMIVEHWFPIAKFPGTTAVPGIAERLPAERTGVEGAQPAGLAGHALGGLNSKEFEMANPDFKLLQGVWSAAASEEKGQKIPKEELTIEGDTFRLQVGTGAYQGTFRIDSSANPKTIDFIWTRFGAQHHLPERTFIAQGIYQLEGDTLKIRHGLRTSAAVPGGTSGVFLVWGAGRPKDFMTPGAWQTTTYSRLRK